MKNQVICTPKFRLGDILTLKAMAQTPSVGDPQRLVVAFLELVCSYDEEGEPFVNSIRYYCRVLYEQQSLTTSTQSFSIGPRLSTGEVLVREEELELWEPQNKIG